MKIEYIDIKNFRAFKEQRIKFDDYNCIVGANGAGKSTVLNALNVFFRTDKDSATDLCSLSAHDFHHKNTEEEISITVCFADLSEEAKQDLSAYVRQEKLIVTAKATFNEALGKAEVTQYGNRLGFESFKKWFEASKSGSKVSELKEIYDELRKDYVDLPAQKTKAAMEEALNQYEEERPEECVLIPSQDQFYGVSKGVSKLAPYIQWVFVAASKDAIAETEETKTSALGLLLDRAVRSRVSFSSKVKVLRDELTENYQKMLDEEQAVLSDLSQGLQSRLQTWSNPSATARVEWTQDPKTIRVDEPKAQIYIGEKGFDSELGRFGHGMQRSFLLSLLQELTAFEDTGPTLIMGIEEPELYQHPPQAKYLSEVLQELASQGSQILACSHSPYFIPGENVNAVRIVREAGIPCHASVSSLNYESLNARLSAVESKPVKSSALVAKLYPTLRPEMNEIFFCKKLILVEGVEDIAYLTTYIELMGRKSQFRSEGWHIVAVGGKSELLRPICIARELEIPLYVIFDADTNKENLAEIEQLSQSASEIDQKKLERIRGEIKRHKSDNEKIIRLLDENTEAQPFWPNEDICCSEFTLWKDNITDTISVEFGERWTEYRIKASSCYGDAKGLQKNPLAVATALELAWKNNLRSSSLMKVIDQILPVQAA
jgi:putative ATP-dependent endonuclease of the OLD family